MPIEVRHSPDPALIGAAGLAAGYGQYQQQQQDRAVEQANRQADRRMQMLQMQLGDRRDQQRQIMAAQQQQLGRQHDFQMFGLRDEQMANRDAAEWENRQIMAERKLEEDKQLFDYQWTAKQKSELERFNNYEQSIRSSPTLNPQEKERLLMELDRQRAGFRPMAIPKGPEPATIDQLFEKGQAKWITDPETGARVIGSFDRSGAPRFDEVKQSSPQERRHEVEIQKMELQLKQQELQKKAVEVQVSAQKALQKVDPETGVTTQPTPQEVEAYIQNSLRLAQGAGQTVQVAAGTAAAGQPAFGQQGGGMQPVPQNWQAGTPMGAPAPQQQTQIGAQFQQPQQKQPQQPAAFSPVLGRPISEADIQETMQKHGVSRQEVLKRLGIQ
jgi:hypothetical protein